MYGDCHYEASLRIFDDDYYIFSEFLFYIFHEITTIGKQAPYHSSAASKQVMF